MQPSLGWPLPLSEIALSSVGEDARSAATGPPLEGTSFAPRQEASAQCSPFMVMGRRPLFEEGVRSCVRLRILIPSEGALSVTCRRLLSALGARNRLVLNGTNGADTTATTPCSDKAFLPAG